MKIPKTAAKWMAIGGITLGTGIMLGGVTYSISQHDERDYPEHQRYNEIFNEQYKLREEIFPKACPIIGGEPISSSCAEAVISYNALQNERDQIRNSVAYINYQEHNNSLDHFTVYSIVGGLGFLVLVAGIGMSYSNRKDEEEEEKKAPEKTLEDSLKRIEVPASLTRVEDKLAAEEEYQAALEDFDRRFKSKYGRL